MRRLAHGTPATRLGLPPFDALENRHVEIAVAEIFGWAGDGPRARIAPSRTVDGFTAACERILEVAAARGRIAFATTRPASLLPLYRRLVARAGAAGADVLAADETGVVGLSGRRVRWIDKVAVLTDGAALLGDDSVDAADEWLFTLARPDLVVCRPHLRRGGRRHRARGGRVRRPRRGSPWPSPRGRAGRCGSCPSTTTDRPGPTPGSSICSRASPPPRATPSVQLDSSGVETGS